MSKSFGRKVMKNKKINTDYNVCFLKCLHELFFMAGKL
ncbi:MAG: hypothetical protein OJF59_003212 [Cytophagales bacterium]|nr:MAG: hypothetical protein OJF59_003212 [Cytophagales bacterium]